MLFLSSSLYNFHQGAERSYPSASRGKAIVGEPQVLPNAMSAYKNIYSKILINICKKDNILIFLSDIKASCDWVASAIKVTLLYSSNVVHNRNI